MNEISQIIIEGATTGKIDKRIATELLKRIIKFEDPKDSREIAIIGMSMRLPKANNAQQFWNNLRDGVDCIRQLPETRREDSDGFVLHYCGINVDEVEYGEGGYLDEIANFDYKFFRMSPKEASLMDPSQRIFLQTTWEAIEDAGYGGKKLRGSKTGVFLGYNGWPVYGQVISKVAPSSLSVSVSGNLSSIIAGRVSHIMDFRGPSMVIDTACSSSLVAVHLACQSILNGECELAVAGGVKINLVPVGASLNIGIESSDYRTRAFDDTSDGTGWGEGTVAVLLKPLKKAVKDGDNIYAVIKGSAVNQDGNSVGITAPNAIAQEDVIINAWKNAGVDPETITYIEAHGTGTKLGDPIEIMAIQKAFRRYTSKNQLCAIGSVKTNIGHLDNTAGMAGLVKAVLALKNKQIPPSLHFNIPNRQICFEQSPVFINDRLRKWETEDIPRRCGVSSFGFSGTNCHIVLEESPGSKELPTQVAKLNILNLSAKSVSALCEIVNQYKTFLEENKRVELGELCYTANTSRGQYSHRLAIVIDSIEDLKLKLNKVDNSIFNNVIEAGIFYGEHKIIHGNKKLNGTIELYESDAIKMGLAANIKIEEFLLGGGSDKYLLNEICQSYVKGADIDWCQLYKEAKIKKISLPVYPFENSRCWLSMPKDLHVIKNHILVNSNNHQKNNDILEFTVVCGRESGQYTETEKAVAQVWGEVLGLDTIYITDNYLELGGDSVMAMKIANDINDRLHIDSDVSGLLQNPILESYAQYVCNKSLKHNKENSYISLSPVEEKEYYPLSSTQKRLFILNKLGSTGVSYNIPNAILIEGYLDVKQLEKAFARLIERQENLRSSFELIDGVMVQRINKNVEFNLDLTVAGEDEIGVIIQSFVQPFDLNTAPLLRAKLIKISEGKYILAYDIHHIISDGTSTVVFADELLKLYKGQVLPELSIQYKDFSEWQNNILKNRTESSNYIKKQEEYWLDTLKGEIPVLNLATDFSRPSIQSFEGDRISYVIKKQTTEKVKLLAKRTGTTLYMVLLAAYNILLFKYTNREDIIIGSPIAGRSHKDLQNIIGAFVNTLVMRNHPKGDMAFDDFLQVVRDNTLKAYENQEYPFEELVNKLVTLRDFSRNPLFDVMFVMQNLGRPETEIEGISFKPYEIMNKSSIFDMNMEVFEEKEGLRLCLTYCTKLYKRETMQRLLNHFDNILMNIINNYQIKLSDIDIMTEDEKNKILFDFNDTIAQYPKEKLLFQLFEEQVKKTPDNISVLFQDTSLSYIELNTRANQLARVLRNRGIKTESIVAIAVERSLEMIVGIMAILKAGGAYLPISQDYPEERIKYMLEDSSAGILLTQTQYTDKTNYDVEVINIDDETLYQGDGTNLEIVNTHNSLAYVIYTSGSTGVPKATMIEHYSVVNRLNWMQKQYSINKDDVILQKTPFTFDVSVWELFWWSITGAKACLLIPGGEKSPAAIVNAIEKYKITTIHFVPSMLNAFLEYIEVSGDIERLKSLRNVFASGEALAPQHVKRFNKLLNSTYNVKLHNLYGPTEATVDVSYFECPTGEKFDVIPIGKPIDNICLYILDIYKKLLPIGIPGELYIAGDGLARGYLNKPQLTMEKFVQNPFQNGKMIYKTGDLARWLPDGNIEYLGRIDYQVKIRGCRIELGEIEALLLKNKYIKEVIVVAKERKEGDKYICAYIVSEMDVRELDLRNYLLRELPEYMIPSYFIQIDKIPQSSNGKIDRKLLPEPDNNLLLYEEYISPINETEHKLVEIWREVLEREKIGVNDNFFEIGGNSLLLIKMHSRIEKLYPGKLVEIDIFSLPTIRKLAEQIDNKKIEVRDEPYLQSVCFPIDFINRERTMNVGSTFGFEIEGHVLKCLKDICFKEDMEMYDVLLAVYISLISEITGELRISIQTVKENNSLIIPIDIELSNMQDFSDLFKSLKDTIHLSCLKAYEAGKLVKAVINREKTEVLLLFSGKSRLKMKNSLTSVFDLVLEVSNENDRILFEFEYNASKLKEERVEELIENYLAALKYLTSQYSLK